MKTGKLRSSIRITGGMANDPGWSFFFLEEKLVPDELGNASVDRFVLDSSERLLAPRAVS
jgi:hypothetical protein